MLLSGWSCSTPANEEIHNFTMSVLVKQRLDIRTSILGDKLE